MRAETIRKTFPRIRSVQIKGDWFYQVDTRRIIDGKAHGKREHFAPTGKGLEEAKKRANDVEAEHAANGIEGLAMAAELRAMAFQGERILAPFGKTILQAAEFYRGFLTEQKEKEESALIATLADEWHAYKKDPKRKLAKSTIKQVRQTAALLKTALPTMRIKELTKKDAEAFVCKRHAADR